jgi:hypothetical protein
MGTPLQVSIHFLRAMYLNACAMECVSFALEKRYSPRASSRGKRICTFALDRRAPETRNRLSLEIVSSHLHLGRLISSKPKWSLRKESPTEQEDHRSLALNLASIGACRGCASLANRGRRGNLPRQIATIKQLRAGTFKEKRMAGAKGPGN